MLLLVTFVLLTLTLPQYVRYVMAVFINYTTSPEAYSNFMLLVQITNKLYFTNNGINFFLYCIGGSKFREDLRRMCCGRNKKKKEKRAERIQQEMTSSNENSDKVLGSNTTLASI